MQKNQHLDKCCRINAEKAFNAIHLFLITIFMKLENKKGTSLNPDKISINLYT